MIIEGRRYDNRVNVTRHMCGTPIMAEKSVCYSHNNINIKKQQTMDPPHIAIRPLNITDVSQVVALEEQGFPVNERCSEEGIRYRLMHCPELCSGLFLRSFSTATATTTTSDTSTSPSTDNQRESEQHQHHEIVGNGARVIRETLIGHVLATKIPSRWITEEAMSIHDESSSTIGVHSLVIHPQHQKKNLATLLMNDYIQKLTTVGAAERLVIIAKEKLVPFYERLGFLKVQVSECTHGGEEWIDMERVLEHDVDDL